MKVFIKLVLLAVIVLFAFFNYRYISFDKGISKTNFEDKNVVEVLTTVAGIEKVEYYNKTIPNDKYNYKVYIVTNEDAYLFDATKDDIDAFKLLGVFGGSLKPEKVTPIPFYVEIIVGIILLAIPFGKRKSKGQKVTQQ